nr:TrkA C-terminal domain-containing protein [Ardenticatenales bacterium]
LVGYTIGRLEDEFEVAVIAQYCEGEFMLNPHDDTTLAAGDRFVVSASLESLKELARLTPPTREYEKYLKGRWSIKSRRVFRGGLKPL